MYTSESNAGTLHPLDVFCQCSLSKYRKAHSFFTQVMFRVHCVTVCVPTHVCSQNHAGCWHDAGGVDAPCPQCFPPRLADMSPGVLLRLEREPAIPNALTAEYLFSSFSQLGTSTVTKAPGQQDKLGFRSLLEMSS